MEKKGIRMNCKILGDFAWTICEQGGGKAEVSRKEADLSSLKRQEVGGGQVEAARRGCGRILAPTSATTKFTCTTA